MAKKSQFYIKRICCSKIFSLVSKSILFGLLIPVPAFSDEAVPGQYLVKFSEDIHPVYQDVITESIGLEIEKELGQTEIILVKEDKKSGLDDKAIKDLLASGIIEIFEPDYIIKLNSTPNDPRFSDLWGLHNTGSGGGTADVDIDGPEAWNINTGSNTVVGVIDTGVLYSHPDLQNNMWVNSRETANGIDDDGNGIVDDIYGYNALTNSGNPLDDNGHGTHCAGTIAATGNNSTGVIGIAHGAKIMALKFMNSSGSGTTSDAIETINYAIAQKQSGVNIRVLSNSWGGSSSSSSLQTAITNAYNNGILFIAAAGNEAANNDTTNSYPANYNVGNVISVASVDRSGNLSSFSNFGATKVHVAAPGSSILSTVLGNTYSSYSGTSMATPHVAGIAALLFSKESSISVDTAKSRIISSVKPLSSLNGLTQSAGIVSASRALSSTQVPEPPSSSISYSLSSISYTYDSSLGTKISSADDAKIPTTLPFNFPFYGVSYPRISISTNGRISPLGANENTDLSNDYNNAVEAGINVLNDDYVASPTNSNGGVWYKSEPDKVTITWIVTPYAYMNLNNPTAEMTFQAVLYSSGRIVFNLKDTFVGSSTYDYGASATSSIYPMGDGSGSAVTISHNSANQTYLGSEKSLELSFLDKAVFSDYDGDGKSDFTVWRPSTGMWYILKSSNNFDQSLADNYQWGLSGDIPIHGDFDGDKKADLVVWRPSDGTWYIKNSSQNFLTGTSIQWGLSGDIPLSGDVDSDKISDLIIYRQSSGMFYVLLSSSGFNRAAALSGSSAAIRQIPLGGAANDPVIGDFNGDGAHDFVTLWQLIRFWQVKSSNGDFMYSEPWGYPGDTPRACNFDSDTTDDRTVIRVNSSNQLDWYATLSGGGVSTHTFGSLNDTPGCKHDHNGNETKEIVVFRNNSGYWYIKNDSDSSVNGFQFGLPGDIPIVY